MKKINFLFLMIVFTFQVQGQGLLREVSEVSTDPSAPKKMDYSLSVGTSMFTGVARGSSFYVAPEFKWDMSPKLKLEAGILLMQNRLTYQHSSNLTGGSVLQQSGLSYDGTLYVSGNYFFNPKLTLYGSVVKDFSNLNNASQNPAFRNSFQMMTMGVNYKLTDAITIGAGFKMVQSNGYLYPGYYNNYGTFSGMGVDPFSPFNRF
ncbi:MAG: hypothetical protein Q8928_04295 [Bacteroidota bacterium]|nr:hypothetical protein [Bacteroidota bacterium]